MNNIFDYIKSIRELFYGITVNNIFIMANKECRTMLIQKSIKIIFG